MVVCGTYIKITWVMEGCERKYHVNDTPSIYRNYDIRIKIACLNIILCLQSSFTVKYVCVCVKYVSVNIFHRILSSCQRINTTVNNYIVHVSANIYIMPDIHRAEDTYVSYTRVCETSAGCLRSIYPSLGMRQLFLYRHNGPVTSQVTDQIKWPNYPVELIGIYVHINTHNKESWHKGAVDRQIYNCVWYLCTYPYGLSLDGWHALLCIANNHHAVTIATHAIKLPYLDDDGETTYETPTFLCLTLNTLLFVFIGEQDKESTTPWLW